MPTTSTTSTSMNMIMDAAAIQEIEAARAAFVLCFFGAVGSAAVGREGTYAINLVTIVAINNITAKEKSNIQ